ncbi:MAG: sulfatase-like hydrolase/transferase [Luteolibacter sp.]|uniref:sulfatase-like hydrolase/transferase n=1 Tax=Luteolibacter sp. TaxID=1962973 RepID=UPI0032651CB9
MKILILLVSVATACAGNNVLLIIADDFGADSQSLYNTTAGATAPTPNINALAASGVRFTNGYACPVCSPTRACLLTGRFGFRTGVGEVISAVNSLTSAELTLPEVIARNCGLGIQSALFGKWHLSDGTPAAVKDFPNTIGGWPHYAGSTAGALTSYTSWLKTTNGSNANTTTYATTDLVNDAVMWINARNAANQPWLAWVAFNAPHTPFHVPPTNLHGYRANPATNLLKYRAAVPAMDTEIGRLLLSVNAATTDIIFIGDNGTPGQVIQPPYGSTHAKDTLYEGGVRVPFIISGPSVTAAGRTDASLVHVVDLFSTMLEMAGVPLPTDVTLDSKSLRPILANQGDDSRNRLYIDQFDQSAVTTGGRVIRDDRYKLIRFNSGNDEFYDILTDPAETTNLFAGGPATMSATHQARYYRLRFNLGGYTAAATPSASGHGIDAGGFWLTVPENAAATQTLGHSTDLDFWSPATNATRSGAGGNITFTVPPPLPENGFFSVLTEQS